MWLTPEAAEVEFFDKAKSLDLAPGWDWPESPISTLAPNGEPVMYKRNFGLREAEFFWYCSWASTALFNNVRKKRRHAMIEVLEFRTTEYFRNGLDRRNKKHVIRILHSARQGDMSGLRQDVHQNCPDRRS